MEQTQDDFNSISSAISDSQENTKPFRVAGKYRGKIQISDDFDEPLAEFEEYM